MKFESNNHNQLIIKSNNHNQLFIKHEIRNSQRDRNLPEVVETGGFHGGEIGIPRRSKVVVAGNWWICDCDLRFCGCGILRL